MQSSIPGEDVVRYRTGGMGALLAGIGRVYVHYTLSVLTAPPPPKRVLLFQPLICHCVFCMRNETVKGHQAKAVEDLPKTCTEVNP